MAIRSEDGSYNGTILLPKVVIQGKDDGAIPMALSARSD
jgi:hypothetical protein